MITHKIVEKLILFRLYKQKVISAFSKLQNEMQYLKSELVQMKTDSNQMKTQLEFSVDTVISKLPDFLKLREKGYIFNACAIYAAVND